MTPDRYVVPRICALCREPRPLKNSHVISEFLYAGMYEAKHRFHVVQAGEQYPWFEQKGYREPLLCQECETKRSVWENHAHGVLTGTVALQYKHEGSITWVSGIEYEPFKLFQLSTFWCAPVAKGDFFSKVRLGPHQEHIRKMLLAGDPAEPRP